MLLFVSSNISIPKSVITVKFIQKLAIKVIGGKGGFPTATKNTVN